MINHILIYVISILLCFNTYIFYLVYLFSSISHGIILLKLIFYHFLQEYILNLLPKNCETTILCTRSIVNEEQDYTSFPSNIICALLPQISNVKVNMFTICMPYIQKSISQKVAKQQSETFEYEKNKLFNMIDETSMPNNKSTCLMLFCNYSGHATAEHMISAVQNW